MCASSIALFEAKSTTVPEISTDTDSTSSTSAKVRLPSVTTISSKIRVSYPAAET